MKTQAPGPSPRTPLVRICPKCGETSRMETVSPLMFARDVDEIKYRCDGCGTETKEYVRTPKPR
jgi:uncharacterized Zn finger protein